MPEIDGPDGRTLSFTQAGAPEGPVVVVHHGTPLAGPPYPSWDADARERGVRLIAYDRPGYGGSTPHPGRTVADAARDVAALLDALGVDTATTWGISGGGPHALACAALLPGRITAVAAVASLAPFDAEGLNYFRGMGQDNYVEFGQTLAGRDVLAPACEGAGQAMLRATAEDFAHGLDSLISAADRVALEDGVAAHWVAATAPTFAQGAGGWVDDDLAFVADWGFDPLQITVPTLLVHGLEDRFVPQSHSRWLASAIPGAQSRLTDDDGHLTLYRDGIPAVHEWLLTRP